MEGRQLIRGDIRAVFPVNYGRLYIAPHLAEFLRRHPHVRLEAIFDDSFNDISGESLDLAIRIGQLEDSRLVARRIATDSRVLVASTGYLDRYGLPAHPTDLLHHNCLHYTRFRSPQRWRFQRGEENLSIAVDGNLRADYGLALTNGRLCEVLNEWSLPEIGVYAVTPSREVPARVKALVDFLAESLPDA